MALLASISFPTWVMDLAFDPIFYLEAHPDLTAGGVDPRSHYLNYGWKEGRDPAPWFSTTGYLRLNPDVAERGLEPLHHYMLEGRRDGRSTAPSTRAVAYFADAKARREHRLPPLAGPAEMAAVREAFDQSYYLGISPDVARDGSDPLQHFLNVGWRENRDPGPGFSVADYLELYPDVAAAGIHPFIHYVTQGRQEGRQPRHSMGFRYEVVSKIKTLAQRQADAERWAAPVLPGSVADLAARLRRGLEGSKGLHLTFSHDNFVKHVGGVQFCLKRESQEVQAEGRVHLHLYPTNPWPTVRAGTSATPLGVIFNGDTLGDFLATDIQTVLDNLALPIARSFAVHSMLGHSSRDVIDTVRSAGMNAGFFWAHDFTSVCAGVHLLRNDIENCRAPPPGSSACQICVYSAGRATHVDQHQRLFASLDLTLVTPSQAALATLKAGTDLDVRAERVLPHVVLKPATDVPPAPRVGPFRLAFPGGALVHKGWPIFRELALRFAPDPRYEFFHLSTEPQPGLPITHHKVSVSAVQPFAMRDAMVDLRIDAALIWSLCQETFSFATFEAWAAGAAIVTGPDSGNVAAVVLEGAPGRVLSDDQALVADFASGKILELSRAVRRPALQDLAFSRMTADLLEPL